MGGHSAGSNAQTQNHAPFNFTTPTLIQPRLPEGTPRRPPARSTQFPSLIGAGNKGRRPTLLGGDPQPIGGAL